MKNLNLSLKSSRKSVNQDAVSFYSEENGNFISVVCDGCSSAANAELGSHFVAEAAIRILKKALSTGQEIKYKETLINIINEVKPKITRILEKKYEKTLKNLSRVERKDFINKKVYEALTTTISLLVVNGKNAYLINIGDGFNIIQTIENKFILLHQPQNIGADNVTLYINDSINDGVFLKFSLEKVVSITQITDGLWPAFLQRTPINRDLYEYEPLDTADFINQVRTTKNMVVYKNYLKEFFYANTYLETKDDMSISLSILK